MSMGRAHKHRLQTLEAVQRAGQQREPAYICVQSEAEIPARLAAIGRRVRVYMGVCPGDWDQDETDQAALAGA